MARTTLGTASLGDLGNGYLGKLIDKALAEIHDDIADRGDEDGAARTLDIKVTFKPKHGQVTITPKVSVKLPALVPPLTVARADAGLKKLVFNPLVPDNPDQKTFADSLHDDEDDDNMPAKPAPR